jgi:hypothetical protein
MQEDNFEPNPDPVVDVGGSLCRCFFSYLMTMLTTFFGDDGYELQSCKAKRVCQVGR